MLEKMGFNKTDKLLIINADDYGIAQGTSKYGIINDLNKFNFVQYLYIDNWIHKLYYDNNKVIITKS